MILGLGIDLVEIKRITKIHEAYGTRFLQKILTREEISHMPQTPGHWLAGRFAAKEACAKALGSGFRHGIGFTEMLILPDAQGKPELHLEGHAKTAAQKLGVGRIYLSITHERAMAAAVVIMEA